MRPDVVETLIKLNHQFYQTFADEFSATRRRLQPGVQNILRSLSPEEQILDLGCGNGELYRELLRRNHQGRYVGLDFSDNLLKVARHRLPLDKKVAFFQKDITALNWDVGLLPDFDVILAFAVLHHLPGVKLRLQTLRKIHTLLAPQGRFIHSNWQFLNSPRWHARIQPWGEVGLQNEDLDPNDYLLDWRRGGTGYRYIHHFSEAELENLAKETGFSVIETFYSDGKEGNLGLYQVWEQCDKI
jgi:SAM-dependent methyltransferase